VGRLGILKKLVWMPLAVALLQGCTSVSGSGSTSRGFGFASDTTAILFYELWESYKSFLDISTPPATSYYGWELKLVDVRFNRVYWSARIDHNSSNSQILRSQQWNDSTMLIELTGEGYWLWTVGNKKPQKVNFNWNVERKNYETGMLVYDFRFRPWKNDSVLIYSKAMQAIIDSRTMTVNDWYPTDENAWVNHCDDFWYGKNSGGCLINKPDGFTLLSDKGDTLGSFTYSHECVTYYDKKCDISSYFYYHFIMASLGECRMSVCEAYPAKRVSNRESHAFIRYDSGWNIGRKPSFWIYSWTRLSEMVNFVDSLGNITEY
jgi:hypothetical protein